MRLYDDRLEVFAGSAALATLPRGRAHANGKHAQVVDYRHVIHSLRRKPMALMGLVYRDQLFPRPAYRNTFDPLLKRHTERKACRIMVDLLSIAHERNCEAALARERAAAVKTGTTPDLAVLRKKFAPDPADLPQVVARLAPLGAYESLIGGAA